MTSADDGYPYILSTPLDEFEEPTTEEVEELRVAADRQDWPTIVRLMHRHWDPLVRAALSKQVKA